MRLSILLILTLLTSAASAQEIKPDKQPRILVAVPLLIPAGSPVKLVLRGLLLDEITEVKFTTIPTVVEIASKGKATVPQNYDARRIGDTQAEVNFTIPPETPVGPLKLVATSAGGASQPYELILANPDELIDDKEPNDGFKTAQSISAGKTVLGIIHEPRNVDVFAFDGKASEKLVMQVQAGQRGSPLDPFLTVYDERGQVIGGSDDVDGRDPRLELDIKISARYFVTIQDANDAGGSHFCYLLKISR